MLEDKKRAKLVAAFDDAEKAFWNVSVQLAADKARRDADNARRDAEIALHDYDKSKDL